MEDNKDSKRWKLRMHGTVLEIMFKVLTERRLIIFFCKIVTTFQQD